MKIQFILFCGMFLSCLSVQADPQFKVDLVSSSRQNIYVDEAWINGAEAVEATVSASPSSPATGVSIKAYFYSAEGKLIHTADKPSPVNARNGSTVPNPVSFDAGKKYSFFFGIPGAIQKGKEKWKRVIVVFGRGEQFSAKVYPKDDMAKFNFPEKASVVE
jgi:hypothetical protein